MIRVRVFKVTKVCVWRGGLFKIIKNTMKSESREISGKQYHNNGADSCSEYKYLGIKITS